MYLVTSPPYSWKLIIEREQACELQSYASRKLGPTDWLTDVKYRATSEAKKKIDMVFEQMLQIKGELIVF